MRGILLISLLTFTAAIAAIVEQDICPDRACSTNCDGRSCNYCSGSDCCRSQECNQCVNDCRPSCSSTNCNVQCVQSCTRPSQCNQCNTCRTTPCRQTCRDSCYRPPPKKIVTMTEKYEESESVVNSVSKAEPHVNITTDIDIRNYINNTNEIENPIEVNSTNINNIKISLPETPRENAAPTQNCCQRPSCPTPSPTQQQPCCNMFNYQRPCNSACGSPVYQTQPQLSPNYLNIQSTPYLQQLQPYPRFLLVPSNHSVVTTSPSSKEDDDSSDKQEETATISPTHYIIAVPQQPVSNSFQQYPVSISNQQYPVSISNQQYPLSFTKQQYPLSFSNQQYPISHQQYPSSFYPGAQTYPELGGSPYLQSGGYQQQPGSYYPGAGSYSSRMTPEAGGYNYRK